ncbi:sensor histidine kinase [Pacificitalea manganoxidans]|nr:sensor histidine kinase [Pacificitalea manganoxidans]
MQTEQVSKEVRQRSVLSLLALTDQAASGERQLLQRSFGAAEALGAIIARLRGDSADCSTTLGEYIEEAGRYSFVGFLELDGMVRCSSVDEALDFSSYPVFQEILSDPRPMIGATLRAPLTEESVVVVAHPLYRENGLVGYVVLWVPHALVETEPDMVQIAKPAGLVTFNYKGDIITAENGVEGVGDRLPSSQRLSELVGKAPTVFEGHNAAGERRVYATVQLLPGQLYALGSWTEPNNALTPQGYLPGWLFPLLMWMASLVVAYFAVHRLVIRHVHRIGGQMRRFARDRHIEPPSKSSEMSQELLEMETDFLHMASALMQDEATLENALRERNILLKEVHHRVKNNLQLISSIMNMQVRKAQSSETRVVLKRLQERVLSLATIHRNLYQTEDLGKVNAGKLIKELVGQMMVVGTTRTFAHPEVEVDVEDVILYPDQAVPLSLMTAEAITNALKNVGSTDESGGWIRITIHKLPEKRARLTVANSKGVRPHAGAGDEPSGLGSQLIRAFATQLGASLNVTDEETSHRLEAEFAVEEFLQDAKDY